MSRLTDRSIQQTLDDDNARRRRQQLIMTEESLRKDALIRDLEKENKKIKGLLDRAKGLARMTLLERDGLVDVIKHLKKSWTPPEDELHYKKTIQPLVDEIVELAKNDSSKQASVEDRLDYALKNG